MEELLVADCHPYLYLDNPEILLKDSQVFYRPGSLNNKVKKACGRIRKMIASGLSSDEVIDQSVELITAELRPSRFGYVCALIASEFPKTFLGWVKANALKDQVLDVVSGCEPMFTLLRFSARTAEQHSIYTTVTNFIGHYLKRKREESDRELLTAEMNNPAARGLVAASDANAFQVEPAVVKSGLLKTDALIIRPVLKEAAPALPCPAEGGPAPARTVDYFKSELLEDSAGMLYQLKAPQRVSAANTETLKQTHLMASKQYLINKGINKSLVFKGLRAQYIGYMGLGLLIDVLFYAVLYMLRVNTYITLLLTVALGALITAIVYHLNATYGEHGLSKTLAKRKTPKIIRSFSRRIFR